MDAAGLLKSQGWRGLGHSLHHSDDSIGLARPILFAQKQNVLGLGTTTHRTSDLWWMNAFDQQLKGMETKADGPGLVQTLKGGELNKIQGRHTKYGIIGQGGLYTTFVRGGLLEGTMETDESSGSESEAGEEDDTPPTSEEPESAPESKKDSTGSKRNEAHSRARKEAKRQRKSDRAAKRLRKAERKEKRMVKEEKKEKSSTKEKKRERRQRKEEKRKSKEIKEERRTRKMARRLRLENEAAT